MLRKLIGGKSFSVRTPDPMRQIAQHLVIACVAAILLMTTGVVAQGSADALPKPISTGELVRYMHQLDLSDQQQLATTAMHDEYKRSYRTLYENEIRDFLEEMRSLSGGGIPERKQLKDISRKLRTMEGRIRSLDSRLFDQMQTILTDDQLAMMPRVRLARTRSTFNQQQQQQMQLWTMGTPLVDLSVVIIDLDLPVSEIAKIDPLLARYESNITSKMARLHDSAATMWLDMYDAIEEAGFDLEELRDMNNAETMPDPEELQKIMEAMQQIMMDVTAKGRDEVNNIRTINRETIQSFKGLIDDDTYRQVRNAYYTHSYPTIMRMTESSLPMSTAFVAELNDITEPQRQAATDAINRALIETDSLIEQAIKLTDKFRATINFMDFDQDSYQQHNKKLQELKEKAYAITKRLNDELLEILSAEQFQQLANHTAETAGLQRSRSTTVIQEEGVHDAKTHSESESETEYAYASHSPDQYLPPRINRRDINIYYTLMNATDDQKAIINELHGSYVEAMQEVERDQIQKVVEAQSKIWRWGSDDKSTKKDLRTSEQRINALADHRAAAMSAIADADTAFFDDVQLLITDDAQLSKFERVQQLRARQRLNTQGTQTYSYQWGNPSQESKIDVIEFLAKQTLDDTSREAIEPILIEYEQTVLPLFEQRYERALALNLAQTLWNIRWQEIQEEEGSAAANAALMTKYQETIGEAQKQLSKSHGRLAEVNAQTIQGALAEMPDADTRAISRRYNIIAFPNIYGDPDTVQPHLENALALNTMTADQRSTLFDLQAEYTPAYEDVCQRMLDISRDVPTPSIGETTDWQDYQKYEDAMQQLRYERTELNSRALLRLRQVLTDDQIQALGNLPEVIKKAKPNQSIW